MTTLQFTENGLLAPGDHGLNFEQLRRSILVTGHGVDSEHWDLTSTATSNANA